MTVQVSVLNMREAQGCSCLRIRPVIDAAILVVVSICVVILRIIGLTA